MLQRLIVSLIVASVRAVLASERVAPPPTVSSRCSSPEYRRLDFWAGDWNVYEVGVARRPRGKSIARARIDVILGGCALREIYEQTDGLVGQSFTIYDSSRKLWHQTWVTNRGQILTIEGRFRGSSLTLEGPQLTPDGQRQIVRGVWTPQESGVREVAQTSPDGGATWRPLFDVFFRRHETGAAMRDDSDPIRPPRGH